MSQKGYRGRILYEPSGRALETARFIAGDDKPIIVCNIAKSCSHMCRYCYCPTVLKIKPHSFHKKVVLKGDVVDKVHKDLDRIHENTSFNPEWLYMCFVGDPFPYGRKDIHQTTFEVLEIAQDFGLKTITLTKGKPSFEGEWIPIDWYGISMVSVLDSFRRDEEKGAAPYDERLKGLVKAKEMGAKTWVSMEPFPTPNIIDMDVIDVLERIKFVTLGIDKLIFGRWNYDERTKGQNGFYLRSANKVEDWCQRNNIEVKIKDDIHIHTLKE